MDLQPSAALKSSTKPDKLRDPFLRDIYIDREGNETAVGPSDVEGRIYAVKHYFNLRDCIDALDRDKQTNYLQATVRKAIVTHMRRLERAEVTK